MSEWSTHERDAPLPTSAPPGDRVAPASGRAARALALQHLAGNQATVAALQRQQRGFPPAADPSLAAGLAALPDERTGPAPADDPSAEAEADAVAVRVGRGELPMPDLSGVTVHADDEATASARDMGARAFTHGTDVYVDRDELVAADARELLAHEAVHATRHATSGLVHAKMQGTKDALQRMGGGPSSGRLRKLVRRKKNWDLVLEAVAAYEQLEAGLIRKGRPSAKDLSTAQKPMLKLLNDIENHCLAWQDANDEAAETAKTEAAHGRYVRGEDELPQQDDPRSKAPRRQAVNMLLPRVRFERENVRNGKWDASLDLSDAAVQSEGGQDAGQMNVVQELTYNTPEGAFSGYFKADKGFDKAPAGHDIESGIRQADPNLGARAVAMTKIDQLLQTNLLARTEFAVHEGKLGTVSETAKGVSLKAVKTVMTDTEQARMGGGVVSMEDPVLQAGLNKLQVLDAICGQLDRHFGNWKLQKDEHTGRVTGLTGIDLDMAFGRDMTTLNHRGASKAPAYRGMPNLVDEELGLRILQLGADDIRAALTGLLPVAEIEATVSRFTSVQDTIAEMAKDGQLTKTWDDKSALATRTDTLPAGGNWSYKSYAQQMSYDTFASTLEGLEGALAQALRGREDSPKGQVLANGPRFHELDGRTGDAIASVISMVLMRHVRKAVWAAQVPAEAVWDLTFDAADMVLADQDAIAKAVVALQESETETGTNEIEAVLTKEIEAWFHMVRTAYEMRDRSGVG